MTKEELLELYKLQPKIRSIASRIEQKNSQKLHLKGLVGSADSLIAASVFSSGSLPHLFILNDKEEAAYFLNNVENFLGENTALFYPASYKKTFHTDELDNASVLLRAEVLSRMNKRARTLIVTYPEAIAEKVVTKKNLEQNSIDLRIGEKISVEFINEFLLHHEFGSTDFVAEAGEFSIRGPSSGLLISVFSPTTAGVQSITLIFLSINFFIIAW